MKKSQLIMIWFLPLIVIGGLFVPVLGYLVLAMMVFFVILSFFKGRYWCWNLCPRGAFLDIVMSKLSRNKSVPKIFLSQRFRWAVFILFISFLIWRLMNSRANFIMIGAIFVLMCIVTTVISIILGIITKHRGWCVICPMGTLQDAISKTNNKEIKK